MWIGAEPSYLGSISMILCLEALEASSTTEPLTLMPKSPLTVAPNKPSNLHKLRLILCMSFILCEGLQSVIVYRFWPPTYALYGYDQGLYFPGRCLWVHILRVCAQTRLQRMLDGRKTYHPGHHGRRRKWGGESCVICIICMKRQLVVVVILLVVAPPCSCSDTVVCCHGLICWCCCCLHSAACHHVLLLKFADCQLMLM